MQQEITSSAMLGTMIFISMGLIEALKILLSKFRNNNGNRLECALGEERYQGLKNELTELIHVVRDFSEKVNQLTIEVTKLTERINHKWKN